MARVGLPYADFKKEANRFVKTNNAVPTHVDMQTALGTTASMGTLNKYLKAWKDECILLSVKTQEEISLDPAQFGSHLTEMWTELHAKREEEIKKERNEQEQHIVALQSQLEIRDLEIKQLNENIQFLQKKCDDYRIAETKTEIQLDQMEQQLRSITDKLVQTESFIPAFKEEIENRRREFMRLKEEEVKKIQEDMQKLSIEHEMVLQLIHEARLSEREQSKIQIDELKSNKIKIEKIVIEKEEEIKNMIKKISMLETQIESYRSQLAQQDNFNKKFDFMREAIIDNNKIYTTNFENLKKFNTEIYDKLIYKIKQSLGSKEEKKDENK